MSIAVDGFPNWFQSLGPNSGVGAGSLLVIAEREVDYAVAATLKLQKERLKSMEVKKKAVDDFDEYIDLFFPRSVFGAKFRSWYKAGKEDGRVIALWPGSALHCVRTLEHWTSTISLSKKSREIDSTGSGTVKPLWRRSRAVIRGIWIKKRLMLLPRRTNEQSRYKNITFDDRDVEHLRYSDNWFLNGTYNASNVGETGTLASSNSLATVTFDFPVPANGFFYYGFRHSGPALYAICIDCDPEDQHFEDIDISNRTDDGHNPPVLLYHRWFETPAQHTVMLKNQRDSRVRNDISQLTLDRFELQVIDDTRVVTVSSGQTSSAPVSQSSTSSSTRNEGSKSIGTITGSVVGVFIGLMALITLARCCWRRRSAASRVSDETVPTNVGLFDVIPYTHISPLEKNGTKLGHAQPLPLPDTSHSPDPNTPAPRDLISPWRERRRAIDMGGIEEQDNDGSTLPPDYDQVFRSRS
ncbi:hypothetical protein VNI00_019255 [Paramarasmius palmivorus]|uniref:Uncharacterized protein n=1 Tax=Paramarasmius palmivorus TaxID=297713 RepID=A0AAW0AP77_9AGAR